MKLTSFSALFLVVLGLSTIPTRSAAAQTPSATVTTTDMQRLQDAINDVSNDVAQLRSRDGSLASQLESSLDNLRDEAAYLRVKIRRNEPVSRNEYYDLRDKVDDIRSRARGNAGGSPTYDDRRPSSSTSYPASAPRSSNPNEIPIGTEFDVRLGQSLSSATAQVEDRFEATTMVDLRDERGRVTVPAGSTMRGVISSVTKATRTERTGKLTVAFDRVTINGRNYPMRATVTQALESEGIRGEAAKIGAGAGVGAIIGGILGGAKGALLGVLIGGGGTIAATEGKDVDLPAGTILRVRMEQPLLVR